MQVIDKEMYHFNNSEKRKDIWVVGNELDNTKDFINDRYNGGLYFSGRAKTNNGMQEFYKIIDCYLELKQTEQTYIGLLEEASRLLKCYSTLQRELVLEQVRKELYPRLVSRKNAIWLCEKRQLKFWLTQLKKEQGELDLFKVIVNGEIFISNDALLPDDSASIIQMYEQAKEYWNPDLTKVDESKNEYLFQGKLKVLEKIKL